MPKYKYNNLQMNKIKRINYSSTVLHYKTKKDHGHLRVKLKQICFNGILLYIKRLSRSAKK